MVCLARHQALNSLRIQTGLTRLMVKWSTRCLSTASFKFESFELLLNVAHHVLLQQTWQGFLAMSRR